jgi:hypothetical protein
MHLEIHDKLSKLFTFRGLAWLGAPPAFSLRLKFKYDGEHENNYYEFSMVDKWRLRDISNWSFLTLKMKREVKTPCFDTKHDHVLVNGKFDLS